MVERTLDVGRRLQTAVGLLCALLLVVTLLSTELWAFTRFRFDLSSLWLLPGLLALLTWLYVGLFIVAHDCMHGALAPSLPGLERPIGHVCLWLYAALDYDSLRAAHQRHHEFPGTPADPDFAPGTDHSFWSWYGAFVRRYISVRQLVVLSVALHVSLLFGASLVHLLLFWMVPALLSSLQLFLFGTYLPHRPSGAAFVDEHRARSNAYPRWLSLLTCFHFGFHHEHHLRPKLPWWRLPALRRARAAARGHVTSAPHLAE